MQKWRQIHAKMSHFALNLERNLSYYGEDAWTDQKRPLYMDEKNISKSGTPIAHGRKYFIICGYMESIPQQPKNTKFRPIEKSNNHKGFQDSGNVFMRFSGRHLWLYGEQHFFMQLCFAERTVID